MSPYAFGILEYLFGKVRFHTRFAVFLSQGRDEICVALAIDSARAHEALYNRHSMRFPWLLECRNFEIRNSFKVKLSIEKDHTFEYVFNVRHLTKSLYEVKTFSLPVEICGRNFLRITGSTNDVHLFESAIHCTFNSPLQPGDPEELMLGWKMYQKSGEDVVTWNEHQKTDVGAVAISDNFDARSQATSSGYFSGSSKTSGSKPDDLEKFQKSMEDVATWNEQQRFQILDSAIANREEIERELGYVAEQEVDVTGGVVNLGLSCAYFQKDALTKSGTIELRIPFHILRFPLLPQPLTPITIPLAVTSKNTSFRKDFEIQLATWCRSASAREPVQTSVYRWGADKEWHFFKKTELFQSDSIKFTAAESGQYVVAISDKDCEKVEMSIESTLFRNESGNLATTHHISCKEVRDRSMEEQKEHGYFQIGKRVVTWVEPNQSIPVEVQSQKDLCSFTSDDSTLKIDSPLCKNFDRAVLKFSLSTEGDYISPFVFNFRVAEENQEITMESIVSAEEIDFDCLEEEEILVDHTQPLHASMTVTSEGEEISCGDCSIIFPKGALSEPTYVSLTLLYNCNHWPEGFAGAFSLIRCEPSGLHFNTPAMVKVRTWYSRATDSEEKMHLFTRWGKDSDWDKINLLSPNQREVEFKIDHFTDFLVTVRKRFNYFGLWLHYLRPFVFHGQQGNFAFGLRTDDSGKLIALHTLYEGKGYQATFPKLSAIKTSMEEKVSMEISCNGGEIAMQPRRDVQLEVEHGDMEEIRHCCMTAVKYDECFTIWYTLDVAGINRKNESVNIAFTKNNTSATETPSDRRPEQTTGNALQRPPIYQQQHTLDVEGINRKNDVIVNIGVTKNISDNTSATETPSDRRPEQTTGNALQQPPICQLHIHLGDIHYENNTIGSLGTGQARMSSCGGQNTVASGSSFDGSQSSKAKKESEQLPLSSPLRQQTSSPDDEQVRLISRQPNEAHGSQVPGMVVGTYVAEHAQLTMHRQGGKDIVTSGCSIGPDQRVDSRHCKDAERIENQKEKN